MEKFFDGTPVPELRSLGGIEVKMVGQAGEQPRRTVRHPDGPWRVDPKGADLIAEVAHYLRQGLAQENPLQQVRLWLDAKRTFEFLCWMGFPHQAFVKSVDEVICEVNRLLRRLLVRRLLLGTTDEEEAKKCLLALSYGCWPDWEEEWDEVEDEVIADIDAGLVPASA
jgi:hypothetical protein